MNKFLMALLFSSLGNFILGFICKVSLNMNGLRVGIG